MRRRNFIKGVGGTLASWRARALMGVAALQVPAQLMPALPAAAQSAANQPIAIVPQIGHSDAVASVAFSPDGRTIVSASDDGTLKLWDAATGRELRTLSGHNRPVWAVAFAPDGRTIVSGSQDQTVKLWDAASGRLLRTLAGHGHAVIAIGGIL